MRLPVGLSQALLEAIFSLLPIKNPVAHKGQENYTHTHTQSPLQVLQSLQPHENLQQCE